MSETEQRAAVVAEAMSWLGTPYHHMGRVKAAGVDCAMLPAEVYAACGLITPVQVSFYPMDWHLHRGGERYLAQVLDYAQPTEHPGAGDFVLWRFGRCLAHGAIVTQWPHIIHAVNGQGVVLGSVEDDWLRGRERRAFTLWGQS